MGQQSTSQKTKNVNQVGLIFTFNLHLTHAMRNIGLDEAQAGIKIARRNINNLRYRDDTTFMAESEDKEPLDESERGE